MIVGELRIAGPVLWCWLAQNMSEADEMPGLEPGQHVAAGIEVVAFVMRDDFQDRLFRLKVEEDVRQMDGAIRARATFFTVDLLFYEGLSAGPIDFGRIPPGSYAVHMTETHPAAGPSEYVVTLFDRRDLD